MEMDLDSLPPVVLCNIFQFLPLTSRNHIRLVSKKWNYICNNPIITKREVLGIYSTYWSVIADVFSNLANSSRSIINLKFLEFRGHQEISFFSEDNGSKSFWLDWGRKIGYLHFSRCHIETDTMSNVLVNCKNLTGFHCSTLNGDFVDVLEILKQNNVILNTATYLCLSDCFENDLQEVLPNIFPNVRELNIRFKNMVSGGTFGTCDCVLTLSKSSNLHRLELNYVSSSSGSPSYLSQQKTNRNSKCS